MSAMNRRRKQDQNFDEMLEKAAVKGIPIDTGEIEVAKETVQSFLEGIFYQDYAAPDVRYMEKEFFEATQDGIEMDIDSGIVREFYGTDVVSFDLEEVDNSYAPKEVAYKCIYTYDFKYWPQGKTGTSYRTNGCRAARFFFERQDDRWVLYGWKDLGEAEVPENESFY